jgi:hypothetical protein
MIRAVILGVFTQLSCAAALGAMDPAGCLPTPQNVNATANADCTPVTISWERDQAEYYNIYRIDPASPGDVYHLGNSFDSFFVDETAAPGTLFEYYVEGVASCGVSDRGGPAMGGRVVNGIPSVNWVYASDSQYCGLITVDWDTGSGASWYDLYRSETPDFNQAFLLASQSYPTYFDTSVGGNVAYYYFVVPYLECVQAQPSASDVGYANFSLSITSQPSDTTAIDGGGAGFSVGISGFGSFQWYRDGQPLFDDGRISGSQSSGLSIYPVSTSDAGSYYCEVFGGCGSQTSDSAYLTVDCSVVIQENPLDMTVTQGSSAWFNIWAAGANGYQWYRDGQMLFDDGHYAGTQTPNLSITFVDYADAGSYYCDAYNGCSTVSSSSGMLTVNAPPLCPSDFNQDGGVDGSDIEAFFFAWEAGEPAADMNQDGGVDGSDVDTFFFHWEGGC